MALAEAANWQTADAPQKGMPQQNLAALKEWLSLRRMAQPKKMEFERKFTAEGRTLTIFTSTRKVGPDEVESVAPKGYRLITPEEGAIMWSGNAAFREFLFDKTAVWVKGFWTSGERGNYRINLDGTLTAIESQDFDFLPAKLRARHQRGTGMIALKGNYFRDFKDGWLETIGDDGPNNRRPVAFTLSR